MSTTTTQATCPTCSLSDQAVEARSAFGFGSPQHREALAAFIAADARDASGKSHGIHTGCSWDRVEFLAFGL